MKDTDIIHVTVCYVRTLFMMTVLLNFVSTSLIKLAQVVTLLTCIREVPARISAGTPTILSEVFCAFPVSR
jgi:hypothetical protein